MMKGIIKALLILSIMTTITDQNFVEAAGSRRPHHGAFSHKSLQFHCKMRMLWTEHALWTRDYIKSSLAGLEEREVVLSRLLRNQQDIGNAIKPYYGNQAGDKLSKLLKEHIVIAGKLVGAVKSNNSKDMKKYNKDWYRNADEIAEFLSSANPYWKKADLKRLLHMHLKMVSDNVNARIKKDWQGDVASFDQGVAHLNVLADLLSKGITQQFPQKF